MQISLSNGKTFEIHWIDCTPAGNLLLEMTDERLLSVIAADFEGVESIEDTETGRKFDGYTNLIWIGRPRKDGTVQITFVR